jgi:PAS domain S-box-containing protein
MVEFPGRRRATVQQVDLNSIIESIDGAIVAMTSSGVITSCNRAAEQLYGYPPQEIIGQGAEVFIPTDLRDAEAAILRRVLAGEQIEAHRTRRICRDGTVLAVCLTLAPLRDDSATVVGAVSFAQRADEPLSQPLPDEPAAQHLDGLSLQAQDAWDQRFQADIEREYARERVQVREAQDRFQVRMGEERAQERVHVYEAQDRFQLRMSEERAEEQVQVQAAQDRFQNVMDAGRARAQQDRTKLEERLHQSQRLEVLGQLAGGVAHDFNNLLAVILNYTMFVAEELETPAPDLPAAGRDIAQIQRAAERAAELTHQLLAFARREVVQLRVLDLNQVVAEVEQLLRRTIGAEVVLHTDLAAEPWPVLADAGQLEQVLANLAINARDAMHDGGTLSIDTANVIIDADTDGETPLRAGRHVRLRVSDTGAGMPADVVDHIFEPFFTTKSEGAGTGLGLSTVYGIITQAGGTITIQSQPGAGTTFTILLPVTDQVELAGEEAVPFRRTSTGETVLIVEDQDALREVTERIFTRSGYRVLTAANGAEAIALAAQHDQEIHLLLTDIIMPNMLGDEVAARIRALKPDVEVLFMSAYPQGVLVNQGRMESGANLIEKPFTAPAIIERAGRLLQDHRPQTAV